MTLQTKILKLADFSELSWTKSDYEYWDWLWDGFTNKYKLMSPEFQREFELEVDRCLFNIKDNYHIVNNHLVKKGKDEITKPE